jgi:hypothetical protein
MRIGVVFPQTELGGDAGAVRAWAQRAGELGFTHVLAYDHVAGADPAVHKGWDGPYDVHTTFHEPMVLYGYLAAVTSMEDSPHHRRHDPSRMTEMRRKITGITCRFGRRSAGGRTRSRT